MQIGFIADVHGDHVALEQTLIQMENEGIDCIVFLGDMVGTNGDLQKTYQLLGEHCTWMVRGNHDLKQMEHFMFYSHDFDPGGDDEPVDMMKDGLTEQEYSLFCSIPERNSMLIADGLTLTIAHANPYAANRNFVGYPAENYAYKRDWIQLSHLIGPNEIVGTAHTHEQGWLDLSKFPKRHGWWLNPGSIGDPEYGNQGEYAVLDTNGGEPTADLRKVPTRVEV